MIDMRHPRVLYSNHLLKETNMGILLLPSLEQKRHIRIENLSQSEAEEFINEFNYKVTLSRKLQQLPSPISDTFLIYRLLNDIASLDIEAILEELSESTVPKCRGLRAVFIDEKTDTILVGTDVVYSANWATIGFNDETIIDTILDYDY